MRIGVFGLGYVGSVTAACLAEIGHSVIGVDIKPEKVKALNEFHSPVEEDQLDALIKKGVATGRLRGIYSEKEALLNSDIYLICVGTPSNLDGSINLNYIKRACAGIGEALKEKNDFPIVVIRSTVIPGTTEKELIPLLERKSGKRAFIDFGVGVNPEFMREGSAVDDFFKPERIVIGQSEERTGTVTEEMYTKVETPIQATIIKTSIKTAEMIKYADNAFHGLKITFANEIGSICKEMGIDGSKVMETLCLDRKLNLSSYYLKPGFAFGGYCIPKDLRALTYRAKELGIESPLLSSILSSNNAHINRGFRLIAGQGKSNIGILGIAFKTGTVDARESPIIRIIELLSVCKQKYHLRVYEPMVKKEEIEKNLPHIALLVRPTLDEVVEKSEVLVVTNLHREFLDLAEKLREDQILIDFSGSTCVKSINPGKCIRLC